MCGGFCAIQASHAVGRVNARPMPEAAQVAEFRQQAAKTLARLASQLH
jgi:hypothetical protein